MSLILTDEKEREILRIKAGKILVSRYNDLGNEYKDLIVELYSDMTKEDPCKIRDFLDFKNEENQFCP